MEQSNTIHTLEAYRAALAPVLRVQQEGLKAFDRLARFQYTIASDVIEHNLAGVRAAVSAVTPVEYLATQGQLNAHFLRKVATHTREFLSAAEDRSVAGNLLPAPTRLSADVQLLEQESSDFVQHELTEEEQGAVQLNDVDESVDAEPETQVIEMRPFESAAPGSKKAKQGKKRSERSRRG